MRDAFLMCSSHSIGHSTRNRQDLSVVRIRAEFQEVDKDVSMSGECGMLSSMLARSSVGVGLSRLRTSTLADAHASTIAVVCHSGLSMWSTSSRAGPLERGFAPAQTNRLTHFRLPSWQN